MPLSSVKHHPRNVRQHPEENILAVMSSLETYGQTEPIVVDKKSQVIAGNGRLTAMQRLKWKTVSIVRANHLSDAQAEAYAIMDNKTTDMSHFDYQALAEVMKDLDGKKINLDLTGFSQMEREPLMSTDWGGEVNEEEEVVQAPLARLAFEPDEWELVQIAVAWAKENLAETYDVGSDAKALAAFCYHHTQETGE